MLEPRQAGRSISKDNDCQDQGHELIPTSFPSSRKYILHTGDIIDIILVMIPKEWVDKMVVAKVEPGNIALKELVNHLNYLENQYISNQANFTRTEKRNRGRVSISPEVAITIPQQQQQKLGPQQVI